MWCERIVSEVSMVCSEVSSELIVGILWAISGISSVVVVLVCCSDKVFASIS